MQFTVAFITAALLVCAAPASSVVITAFAGAGCSGSIIDSKSFGDNECVTLGSGSAKSWSYSGVPSVIQFFVSGGAHDNCSNGSQLTLGGGSGCATAPDGFNWESAAFN